MSIFPTRRRIERRLQAIKTPTECRDCESALVNGTCVVCYWGHAA